ncbi:MAG: hypothetical protein HYW49_12585 [Deltaproteobacteria bacterium]|nr:hypothetical protein [Deltaproteobacteria bacterium]
MISSELSEPPSEQPEDRATGLSGAEPLDCPDCGDRLVIRKPKQKLLAYLLFIASFAAFIWYTSSHDITLTQNAVWLIAQLALGVWAAVQRIQNRRPIFYCRRCRTRLPS